MSDVRVMSFAHLEDPAEDFLSLPQMVEGQLERFKMATNLNRKRGYTFRNFDESHWKEDMVSLHELCRNSFATNWSVTPIAFEEFADIYDRRLRRVGPDHILLNENSQKECRRSRACRRCTRRHPQYPNPRRPTRTARVRPRPGHRRRTVHSRHRCRENVRRSLSDGTSDPTSDVGWWAGASDSRIRHVREGNRLTP